MVKFGERMASMQHLGWEAHYIQYGQLKLLIAKLDTCNTQAEYAAASNAFANEVTTAFERVNSFVLSETASLRTALEPGDAASVRKVHSALKVLRRHRHRHHHHTLTTTIAAAALTAVTALTITAALTTASVASPRCSAASWAPT